MNILEEQKKVEYCFKLYKEHSGCTVYELYFVKNGFLWKIELEELPLEAVKLVRESSKNGGKEKLRLYVNAELKEQFLLTGKCKKIMTKADFEKQAKDFGRTKGHFCEYLSNKSRNLTYKVDVTRFDKAGDINLKRKKIQVKFENASLAQLDTILKVANS